jgi:hypothetical protein
MAARIRVWQRRYRATQREDRRVPDIGADEISFYRDTMARGGRRRRSARWWMCHRARGYSKLTRKLRTRRLSSQLNLSSSGPRRLEVSVDA